MRKTRTWQLVAGLLVLSVVLYAALFAVYSDRGGDIGFYTLLDIAFIPVSAVLFTLVINRLLEQREKEALLNKLNMVVGAFFSETGTELIDRLVAFDGDVDTVRPHLLFTGTWKAADFEGARRSVAGHESGVRIDAGDLEGLKVFLVSQRSFLLRLLENQTLLEHETFTDMLWAVFHLTEELAARSDLSAMPPADHRHVELDMARAYGRLLSEWLRYVEHLKGQYPYLYSFAVRMNPFDPDARVTVEA
jgi:hypothetical protein